MAKKYKTFPHKVVETKGLFEVVELVYKDELYRAQVCTGWNPLLHYDPVNDTVLMKEDAGGLGKSAYCYQPVLIEYWLNHDYRDSPTGKFTKKVVNVGDRVEILPFSRAYGLKGEIGVVEALNGEMVTVSLEKFAQTLRMEPHEFKVLREVPACQS